MGALRPCRVYWSGVRNQSHAAYGASWLRAVLAASTAPVTLVEFERRAFLGGAVLSDETMTHLMPSAQHLTRTMLPDGLPAPRGDKLFYLAVGTPGIKPWLRLVTAHPGRRLTVVVTDEGIGSYGTWKTRRAAWMREGHHRIWATVRAWAHALAGRLLTTKRWRLYERHQGHWQVNPAIAAEFKRHTTGHSSGDAARYAVFFSQPWVEMGVLAGDVYRDHIRRVAEQCTAAGYAFAVRPHPAEDASRYAAWETWAGAVPAELDPQLAHVGLALGGTSTALLNLAAVYQRPTIRVTCPGLEFLDEELSSGQASLLNQFCGAPVPDTCLHTRLTSVGHTDR